MSRLKALTDLAAALRGAEDPRTDWMGVIALANQALVTPAIHAAALRAGTVEALPPDVRTFTSEVFARNRERNRRLFGQLHEAVGALNAVGIEPTLLKGAALWVTLGRPIAFDRMLNDLDLLVRPSEAQAAIAALREAGFHLAASYAGPEVHVVAELGRPSDVGYIDLHQRPPGPPGLAERPSRHQTHTWDGVRARVPDPAAQIFYLVLHDQFHEGGYWRGGVALRHLLDIAMLTGGPAGVDWTGLRRLASRPLIATAVEAQLIAAHRFTGAEAPPPMLRRPWARLQHARQLAQFARPKLAGPLAGLGLISEAGALISHRRADAADRRRMFGTGRRSMSDRLSRLRELRGAAAPGRI